VVDPGVGSERRALAMRVGNRFLVGPDNGIFWPLWKQAGDDPALLAVELSSRRYFHEPVSATFHGRDVFAPVAAHLAQGVELTDLGPEIEAPAALRLPTIQREPGVLLGQIVRVDHFGNCITNISRADLIGLGSIDKLQIKASGQGFGPLRNTYSQVEPGQALALIDSNGMLELAMRDGPLAKEFDLAVGSQVRARCS
jgi:S-adenosylmethionine hydrolase